MDVEVQYLPAPGIYTSAEAPGRQILASTAYYVVSEDETLVPGQGLLVAGTVITYDQRKQVLAYTPGAQAYGVLRYGVDTSVPYVVTGDILISGILKRDLLVGLDDQAVADLNGRFDLVNDYFIF